MDMIFALTDDYISADNLISLLAGLSMLAVVAVVWSAFVSRNPMARRMRNIMKVRDDLQAGIVRPKGNDARRIDAGAITFMSRVVQRLHLLKTEQTAKITAQLAQAGWRSRNALIIFLFTKVALPITLALGSLALLSVVPAFAMPLVGKMAVSACAAIAGFYAPEIMTRNAIQRRYHEIQKALPDALDLLVICAEAGLSLDAALTRVADEMGRSGPELSDEFALTAVELGFLPSRRQALENLMARCELPAIRGVVATLSQTEKYGTPLANSLRVLSGEFRDNRMMRAEEKAARLPATLTVPLVVFILPSLFVVLLGPAILRAIDGFSGM